MVWKYKLVEIVLSTIKAETIPYLLAVKSAAKTNLAVSSIEFLF